MESDMSGNPEMGKQTAPRKKIKTKRRLQGNPAAASSNPMEEAEEIKQGEEDLSFEDS